MPRHKLYFRKRTWTALLSLLLLLLAAAIQRQDVLNQAQQTTISTQPGLYAVPRFVDGDTIVVSMAGKDETVRMIGVDTPETHKPNTPVQCYGPAAAAFTKNSIGMQRVRLEADPLSQNRDRYGRLLRYVYLQDGRLLEAELIRNGYGFAYTVFPFSKADVFVQHEESAAANHKGLWSNCTVTEENGRKQTNALP